MGIYSTDLSSNISFNLKSAIGFNSRTYTETEGAFTINGKSTDICFKASGGMAFRINNSFRFTAEVGYRFAKLSGFSNDIKFFDSTISKVELDFSGVFTRNGILFKF